MTKAHHIKRKAQHITRKAPNKKTKAPYITTKVHHKMTKAPNIKTKSHHKMTQGPNNPTSTQHNDKSTLNSDKSTPHNDKSTSHTVIMLKEHRNIIKCQDQTVQAFHTGVPCIVTCSLCNLYAPLCLRCMTLIFSCLFSIFVFKYCMPPGVPFILIIETFTKRHPCATLLTWETIPIDKQLLLCHTVDKD